ncbi:Bax inhibitor-like protein [Euroglyphus maynei]|uniref:Bax inhibitor-like protein n=1 Tax=Euroglyphus maynei TaxID=6958 RepID=A0A1Y3BT82_EURMA|nr:Bax inhibitor-like protein [Euroglyphus maynei]
MAGLLIALYSTPDNGKNQSLRLNYLLGFSFFSGFGLGPLIEHTLYIDANILPTALMATSLIFVCFTISAIYGNRRKTLFYGGILFSGLSLLAYMSLINLFFRSQMMYKVCAYVYIAFAIMCAFVIYDTAFIIEKRLRGDTDYIG